MPLLYDKIVVTCRLVHSHININKLWAQLYSFNQLNPGRSSVGLERTVRIREVAGSSPVAPRVIYN